MALHTGEDLYTCNYCPKTFKSKANMYTHRKKKHTHLWTINNRNNSIYNPVHGAQPHI